MLEIDDKPEYAWRGLLVDVARHFLPPRLLVSTLDAMAAAKLNVLHLHLTDSQSFPLLLQPQTQTQPRTPTDADTDKDADPGSGSTTPTPTRINITRLGALGAFSPSKTYTERDLEFVVEQARLRV